MEHLESLTKKISNEETSKDGFFDLPLDAKCTHPGHLPPNHLYIPPRKGYKHICPSCKKITVIIPPQISL